LINMELGRFSVMSGQYDKAIERFIVVLQKDSLNLQAHFLLAESYMAVGDTLQSVEVLRRTQGLTGDPVLDNQVRQYIESLTN
jgi:lipopolysaccharide biosynthesis regulator YciM